MMSSAKGSDPPRFAALDEAYAWLDSHINYERFLHRVDYGPDRFALEPFRALLGRLGDPHREIPAIHIAGTRGKGTSAMALEALLRACGYRTATYTSPHLREYRERISIDGQPLGAEAFCRALEAAARARNETAQGTESFKTVFEYLTAIYFLASREAGIGWRIVETGLGGRLDATNALDAGAVLLTRIGLEHTHLLGDTIAKIAAEKAAILKTGGWGVMTRQDASGEAEAVFRSRALAVSAELSDAGALCPILSAEYHPRGMRLVYEFEGEALELNLPLFGPFVAENLQGALAMFAELRRRGLITRISRERIAGALQSLRLPGRMQPAWLNATGEPQLLIDSAHCPTGAAALAESIQAHFGSIPAVLVAGMMSDKQHDGFFEALGRWPHWRKVICYKIDTPRAESAESLARFAASAGPDVKIAPDLMTALELAAIEAEEGYRLIAAGSIYPVASILDWSRNHVRKIDQAQSEAQADAQSGPGNPGAERQAIP